MQFDLEALKSGLGSFGFLLDYGFWTKFYYFTRLTLMYLGFFFLAASALLFLKIWPFRMRLYVFEGHRAYKAPQKQSSLEEEQKRASRRKWDEIVRKAEAGGPAGYPMAIIEADVLLENSLGRMGFLGKNLAERLRSLAPSELPNVNDVWEAHKLRNKIAHEPDFKPSQDETTKALGIYKKALEDLGVI